VIHLYQKLTFENSSNHQARLTVYSNKIFYKNKLNKKMKYSEPRGEVGHSSEFITGLKWRSLMRILNLKAMINNCFKNYYSELVCKMCTL